MKYKFYLMPLLCMFIMAACSNGETENIIPPTDEPETYIVSFNLGGEIEVSQEDLSRGTATDDVYGINVYYNSDKGEDIDDLYAYGVFDNKEDMSIPLLSGYKYKFECTLVKNGKKTLYYGQAFDNAYTGVCYPFQTNETGSTLIGNKFIIGTTTYLSGIKKGNAHLASVATPSTSNSNAYASVNRFYGETTDYEPTDGGQVTIELKRVVFGAKFVITGVQEGTLEASCGSFWSKTTTVDDEGTAVIYSYPDVYDCWLNESNLTETVTLKFTSDRGKLWDLSSTTTVTFKRNVLTTVNINVSPDLSSGTFTLTEEALEEDANYIDLEINTDGVIDTPVNPTE